MGQFGASRAARRVSRDRSDSGAFFAAGYTARPKVLTRRDFASISRQALDNDVDARVHKKAQV